MFAIVKQSPRNCLQKLENILNIMLRVTIKSLFALHILTFGNAVAEKECCHKLSNCLSNVKSEKHVPDCIRFSLRCFWNVVKRIRKHIQDIYLFWLCRYNMTFGNVVAGLVTGVNFDNSARAVKRQVLYFNRKVTPDLLLSRYNFKNLEKDQHFRT